MLDILKQGQKLIKKAEKHNAIAAKTLVELHVLAGRAVEDHGVMIGLDEPQIAALVVPKEPRNPG